MAPCWEARPLWPCARERCFTFCSAQLAAGAAQRRPTPKLPGAAFHLGNHPLLPRLEPELAAPAFARRFGHRAELRPAALQQFDGPPRHFGGSVTEESGAAVFHDLRNTAPSKRKD